MITKAKIEPFVALVVVSIGVALSGVVTITEEGMDSAPAHIATIIALGAMPGRIIELCGCAASLAHSLIDRCGKKRSSRSLRPSSPASNADRPCAPGRCSPQPWA